MNNSESAMQNALVQFNKWLQDRGVDFSQVLSGSLDFSKSITSKNIQPREYDQAIDVAKRLETMTSIAKDFIDSFGQDGNTNLGLNQDFIDINRNFGDLVKEGPKTAVEEKLMNAVDTFLSPQEKKQAIEQNLTVGDVIKQVDQSIQKSQEMVVQTMAREKQREKEKTTPEVEQKPEKKMTSLGEEYGVLNEIVKSMRSALEGGKEQALEKEKSQSKPQSITMETVTMDSIGNNLRNMGKDPNHVQDRGQVMTREK